MSEKHPTTADRVAQCRGLYERVDTKKPTKQAVQAFRTELEQVPDLWRVFGDMCWQAQLHLIDAIGLPRSSKEAITFGMDTIRKDLSHAEATPLEKMLIEQIALCWLRLSIVELNHADNVASGTFGIPQADYWDRALSSAQRRYLRAIEALARVRRLLRPNAVQVNIGAQQVNVASVNNIKQ